MTDTTPLSVAIESTFKALGETPGIMPDDDGTETILGEVESVLGRYRTPEEVAAEADAERRADEALAQSYRQPATIAADALAAHLKGSIKTAVIGHGLGDIGLRDASAALSALPRDLLTVMDGEGFFGTGESWQLIRDIGERLRTAPMTLDAAAQHDFTPDDVSEALGGRLAGLPPDAASSLAVLLNSLPPATVAALEGLENDRDLLELAVHLGRKLWGFTPPKPQRKDAKMTTTTRRPVDPDELVRQAKKLQASPAYYNTGDPDHQKVRATVQRIYQTAYPQPKETGR